MFPSRRTHVRPCLLLALLMLCATACAEDAPHRVDEATQVALSSEGGEPAAAPRLVGAGDVELDAAQLAELATVTTAPGDLPHLQVVGADELARLPLEHTHVRAEVSGSVAQVEVTQTYVNQHADPIEAVYVFPLPENSAVDAMKMVIGERVIEAEIHKRDEARQIYETAKSEGHTTALLEQERPNVFTQSVANIAPGESIEVVVRYVQPVTYDDGGYEFVFPMVVGPRYVPGEIDTSTGRPVLVPDTSQVPDWQRITPPILGEGLRTGHDISLELIADVGLEVADIDSPTHQIALEDQGQGRFELVLAEQESQPNRDFVVRYRVAGDQPVVGLVSHKASEQAEFGHFSLMVQPPALELDELVGERELIFVVDVSGSMGGRPLAQCKQAMRQLLAGLRPTDTFNVITFSGRDTKLFEHSVPVSDDTVRRTIDFLAGLRANGGTNLGSAVESALGAEPVDGRNRYVFFMTDAQVGQEDAILGGAEQLVARFGEQGARARVFSFGVGYHPNQHLIERLAEVGDGLAVYATADEDPARAVDRFFGLIDHPVMEQVWVDWGALPVESVQPARVPDLFASRPLELHGRYAGAGGTGEVVVHGRIEGQPIELVFDVELPSGPHGSPAQATLWARSRIADFERDLWSGHEVAAAKTAITELALEHGLVTKFTSFVAVDRSRVVGNGDPTRIDQPTEPKDGLPLGEGYDAVSGLGVTGHGVGGGGSGNHGLGTGNFGTAGRGGGSGYGKGSGKLGDKAVSKPRLQAGRPTVTGSLDKRIVRKVVNQHKRKLKACYEAQLPKEPTLSGRVEVRFTIDATGQVIHAAATGVTLTDATVLSCVETAFAAMRFPAFKGGGKVTVSYPVNFENPNGVGAGDIESGDTEPIDPARITGALTEETVLEVFRTHDLDVSGCRVQSDGSEATGALRVSFTIDAQGFATGVAASGAAADAVGECVVERIGSWRFEASEGTTTVEMPL